MILKNILLIVKDLERSRRFYQDVLGLVVTADLGKKTMFAGGLVFEEGSIWEDALPVSTVYGGNDMELYFEVPDMEFIRERLERSDFDVEFLEGRAEEASEVLRFYDPDRHLVEVRALRPSICK